MSRIDKLRKEKNDVISKARTDATDFQVISREARRVADVAGNAHYIISDLDARFEKETGLNRKDISFLFFAVALQCARWCLQPKVDMDFQLISREERHDAQKDGYKEKTERLKAAKEDQENEIKSKKYPSCSKIWMLPVPYDAMAGTERIWIPGVKSPGVQLTGANHHSATLGHDPVLGYIFGPLNIMTRTITFKNPGFQTCEVHLNRSTYIDPLHHSGQYVTIDLSIGDLLTRCLESGKEDIKRIPTSISRHVLHMQSDKFCKDGLPVPFVSAEKAQILIDSDWNSYELERLIKFLAQDVSVIGVQALISILINAIIETLHKLSYDLSSGVSKELYAVKTRKILTYSNIIATGSNVIASAVMATTGLVIHNGELIRKSIGNIDYGGLLVTIYRIINDGKFRQQIKEEFLANEFYNIVTGM